MISDNRDMSFISLFRLFEIIKSIGWGLVLNGWAIRNLNKIKTTSCSSQGFICEQWSSENSEYIYGTAVNDIIYFGNFQSYMSPDVISKQD